MYAANYPKAIALMILTGMLGVVIHASSRPLGAYYSPGQLVFLYHAIAFVMMLSVMRSPIKKLSVPLRTNEWKWYAWRSVLEVGGFALAFIAIQKLPLTVVLALSFTQPLMGTVIAVLFFREVATRKLWLALAIGFAGVLIITRPGSAAFDPAIFYVLGSTLCYAICGNMIRRLTATERTTTIAFYMLAGTSLLSAPLAVGTWQPLDISHIPYLLILGVLVFIIQQIVGLAFAYAPATVILPFMFLNIVWGSLIAYFAFGEMVDIWTVIGATVVVIGAVLAVHASRSYKPAMEQV